MNRRRVYYATNPENSNYRWFTRNPDDYYVILHNQRVSKSSLRDHSFYDEMDFKEVTVPETVEWVNYMLDTGKFLTQKEFQYKNRNVQPRSLREYQEPGRGYEGASGQNQQEGPKKDDVVICTAPNTGAKWIFRLGKLSGNRWDLERGFPMDSDKIGNRISLPSGAFAEKKDIERVATPAEELWFQYCIEKGIICHISEAPQPKKSVLVDVSGHNTKTPIGLISFGSSKSKKEKTSKTKVKFQLSKIKNYEY